MRSRTGSAPSSSCRTTPRSLADEHLVIHDAIQGVDLSLVEHINHPDDYDPIQAAIGFLTDALLSHSPTRSTRGRNQVRLGSDLRTAAAASRDCEHAGASQ